MSDNTIEDMSFKIVNNLCIKMSQYSINKNSEELEQPKNQLSSFEDTTISETNSKDQLEGE